MLAIDAFTVAACPGRFLHRQVFRVLANVGRRCCTRYARAQVRRAPAARRSRTRAHARTGTRTGTRARSSRTPAARVTRLSTAPACFGARSAATSVERGRTRCTMEREYEREEPKRMRAHGKHDPPALLRLSIFHTPTYHFFRAPHGSLFAEFS